MVLHDISRDGAMLVSTDSARRGVFGLGEGQQKEHDLSFLDWTRITALSPDGKMLLFDEQGEGGGPNYSVYIRNMDGSPPTRLSEGYAQALSPDGKWVLAACTTTPQQLYLVPVGAGDSRQLTNDNINHAWIAFWTADSKAIIFNGSEQGHPPRAFRMDANGGPAHPVTAERNDRLRWIAGQQNCSRCGRNQSPVPCAFNRR